MNTELTTLYVLTIKNDQLEAFRHLMTGAVGLSRKEPGTLKYQINVSNDSNTVTLEERYRDSESFISHVEETFAPIAEQFLQLANIDKLYVFGPVNEKAKVKLESFGAIFMNPMTGF